MVLELDVERGKSHDVGDPLVWRALEWAARKGRIASIIGGPPQNTFMLRRSMSPGPEPLRSNSHPYGGWHGQSDKDREKVNRHTGLFVKMIYLHALATAGRIRHPAESGDVREVGFMLEQPKDPRSYLLYTDPLAQDSVSFWRTSLWEAYAEEAGLSTFSFDMSSLGKALIRHTTVGTNLPLRHLDGLKGRLQPDPYPPERAPPSVWTREFSEVVAIAVRAQRLAPRMLRMSADQWREHVRRGHLPYRSDCMTCVSAGATGRRHARVEHPSCFVMSADVSGPLKIPGLDADGRGAFPKPHKYLFVAKVKIPRSFVDDGRGAAVDYDPGEAEELAPPKEEDFDYEDPATSRHHDVEEPADDEEEADHGEEGTGMSAKEHEDEIDVTGPDLVNLIFASGLHDNRGTTVLEAIQDVVLYCSSLNIPIVRFHCDRGMEFYARSTRQWIKNQGIRFTTSEGGLHQQNGIVENAVKFVKQRTRTVLLGAKLPQRVWPQAASAAAAIQRAAALGMETRLAAPFGARVLIRKREYGGVAEPGKPDDLAPRWIEGHYLGLSETLRRGHIVYVNNDDGEKFVHTVHVRAGLVDPGGVAGDYEADPPEPPLRRLREKAKGSGDVVSVSKVGPVASDDELKKQAKQLSEAWSQEEADELIVRIALSLGPNDKKFGVFRHGGSVGLTRVTYEKPWAAELLGRAFLERVPEVEFSAIYVSVNANKEVHADYNNLNGTFNHLLPIVLPKRGGDLWMELSDGDVVRGKVSEMVDHKGGSHFGCVIPLKEGYVTTFNPQKRHAVTKWKGLRITLIAYTPGVPQNLKGPEREVLSALGFPVPVEVLEVPPAMAIRSLSVHAMGDKHGVDEEHLVNEELEDDESMVASDGLSLWSGTGSRLRRTSMSSTSSSDVHHEEIQQWDMYLALDQEHPETSMKARIASSGAFPVVAKAEVSYTKGIEGLLDGLQGPLDIVHTVDPTEAARSFEKWTPSVLKELKSFEPAINKVSAEDAQVINDIENGIARIVPMKLVYTVKPPGDEGLAEGQWFRRKSRIVACGNMLEDSGEETYTGAAPADVVRSSLAISSRRGWNAAVLDVTSAFLQTPLNEVNCSQRILGKPPRALVKAGLCGPSELWEFTRAVYGLRESPKWWGQFRDLRLAQLVVVVGTRKIRLAQCKIEGSWWKLLEDTILVGILVVYVDDLLICATDPIIKAVAEAVRQLWKTSALALASEGAIRFLGIEIVKIQGGFALNQEPYIRELIRIHDVKPTQLDVIPVARDQACFEATAEETIFTERQLREAQQYAGEVLWLSQRTRPDLAYSASLIASLSTKAPARSSAIARKCLGFLQRTADYFLKIVAYDDELASWSDASFAPEGGKSHSGWIVTAGSAPVMWRSSRQSVVTLSTAEAELASSVEGALALLSIRALFDDVGVRINKGVLKLDSQAALAIQGGSSSWRTRHLRIKSSWVTEKVDEEEFELEHCPGNEHIADALTKPLTAARLRMLSRLLGLMPLGEIHQETEFIDGEREASSLDSNSNSSSKASAPNPDGAKVLIALLILSQSVTTAESYEIATYEPIPVDHGLAAWFLFGLVVLSWTLAWECFKYVGWQFYYRAAPGAEARRLRRLQRIRETTSAAIQYELDMRRPQRATRETPEIQRAQGARGLPAEIFDVPDRRGNTARTQGRSSAQKTVYRSNQKDIAIQTTGPAFRPTTPDIRTEVRTELRIPEEVHVVPGRPCFHVFNPCYAFRHTGTQAKVQTLRACEFCVRHQGRDPNVAPRTIDEILRNGSRPLFDRPGSACQYG